MIVAIIQARLSSARLPGKVLMDICGKPMLQRIIERVKKSKLIDDIIIAIPKKDEALVSWFNYKTKRYFLGSENDVLDRFYRAAPLDSTIVRLTADCPLIDPEIIDRTIQYFLDHDIDYIYNLPPYPDGLDTEVFNYKTLVKTWKEAEDSYDREHVTTYIRRHPELFRIGNLAGEDISHLKWSVDELRGLNFVRQVYQHLGEDFHLRDILKLIKGGKKWLK